MARILAGSTSLRAASRSTPRKMSCARIAGRLSPIWLARELVIQFPINGRRFSPGESRGSRSARLSQILPFFPPMPPRGNPMAAILPAAIPRDFVRPAKAGRVSPDSTPGSLSNLTCRRRPSGEFDSSGILIPAGCRPTGPSAAVIRHQFRNRSPPFLGRYPSKIN